MPDLPEVRYAIRSEFRYRPGKPVRDPEYLRFVRSFPCVICNQAFRIEAAHTGPHGIGQKSSDFSAIPLCHSHHKELHRLGPARFHSTHFSDVSSLVLQLNEMYRERTERRKTA